MDKVEASKSRPIFALFVNGTAPETERLVELAKHHEMVTFTSIDCMNESVFCEKYSIRDTPAAKLIRGDDSLYWRSPDDDWDKFLEDEVRHVAFECDNETFEPRNETHFHLLLRKESRKALEMYIAASDYYKIFGCTFSYSLGGSEVPVLTAFMSHKFNISRRVRPIEIAPFVERARFAMTHSFTPREFIAFSQSQPTVLFIRHGTERNPLLDIVDDTLGSFRFGEMSHEMCESLLSNTHLAVPRVLGFNQASDCLITTQDPTGPSFYKDLQRGQNCTARLRRTQRVKRSASRSGLLVLASMSAFLSVAYFGFIRTSHQKVKLE